MSIENNIPYKAFGDRIKFLREQWQQSLREVSCTLEVDLDTLRSIEEGRLLPDIDVLDMLISHFLLTEDQAEDLRDLADLGQEKITGLSLPAGIEEMLAKQIVMYLPVENKVMYTDAMNANVNAHGVILQFMQQLPNNAQPAVVSRLGMSREHAEKVIKVLTQTLQQYDLNKKTTKNLPTGDSETKTKNKD